MHKSIWAEEKRWKIGAKTISGRTERSLKEDSLGLCWLWAVILWKTTACIEGRAMAAYQSLQQDSCQQLPDQFKSSWPLLFLEKSVLQKLGHASGLNFSSNLREMPTCVTAFSSEIPLFLKGQRGLLALT